MLQGMQTTRQPGRCLAALKCMTDTWKGLLATGAGAHSHTGLGGRVFGGCGFGGDGRGLVGGGRFFGGGVGDLQTRHGQNGSQYSAR